VFNSAKYSVTASVRRYLVLVDNKLAGTMDTLRLALWLSEPDVPVSVAVFVVAETPASTERVTV
jgi:hypothetical protein